MATIIAEHIVGVIEKISLNDNKGKLLLNDGTWLSWFQTDLKGNITAPHASFQQNHVEEGQTWQIKYTSKPSADGRMIFKNVLSFSPVNGAVPQQAQQAQTPKQQTAASVPPVNTDYAQKHEDEVIGKMAFGFMELVTDTASGILQAAIQSGNVTIQEASQHVAESVRVAGMILQGVRTQVDGTVMLAERMLDSSRGPKRKRKGDESLKSQPRPIITSHPIHPLAADEEDYAEGDGTEPEDIPEWV
jgi:hypothetical protein